jgi:predicted metalloendopeptidase
MTPPTNNAYYNPTTNEICFPAGILQPPYFDAKADDAANYGGIGATIGHEISHGFDDEGSQFDASGNLRVWWTEEDRKRFEAKTRTLVAQYAAFSPLPGYHVNGELTLGENIADNSGLEIAYKAYRRSLGGRPGPVIDGMSADQRFFYGFAQAYRSKIRDQLLLTLITSDPHSPDRFRVTGAVRNHPAFYSTFGVRPGDGMYLPPEDRVSIW